MRLALVLIAAPYLLYQVRKPSRWVGRLFLWMMNVSHSGLTDWGLRHVHWERQFTILDVGCGGGRTVEKLAGLASEGFIHGIDYAKGSVAASRRRNAPSIQTGRVEIREASVSHLPFSDDKFDVVTAVETHYYWPDLVKSMQEVLRVLKPGEMLVIVAESYNNGAYSALQRPVMKLLRAANLTVEEHRALFSTAGYTDIQIFEERSRGWICGTGKKPLRSRSAD
jgi:SAM-dependent methyltransferase